MQDGQLVSQGDEFEFQRGATTNPEREQGTEGGQKREHADDGMTAAPETLHLLGFLKFCARTGKDSTQMGVAKDDDMVEAFPADRADQSLRMPVLPG